MQVLPENLRLLKMKDFNSDAQLPVERELGVQWDAENDKFIQVNLEKYKKKLDYMEFPTIRHVLRLVMTIVDPLGFINNLIVEGRMIL
ncbi:hypothetical protein JTB14_020858 [Gonioctena quinquepunctata]|nr:hypothetical protein JTB14_020858 [Gonioctena quinquepunctata]